MTTPFQFVHIPLDGSQDDKTARLARGPGVMRRSVNVDHSHAGEARKRRGTTRLSTSRTTHGQTPEAVFVALGSDRGDAVLVGRDRCYGVAANAPSIDSSALVLRGPSMVGAYTMGLIHAASIGSDS